MANPNDLSLLDENQPINTPVNTVNTNIRATRSALKGWAAVEHDYNGRHAFLIGDTAHRPGAADPVGPAKGTIYINTQIGGLEYFDGTQWVPIIAPSFLPVGTVVSYAGLGEPSGWFLCDGRAVSRTDWAALFAVIGTLFGVGDGSTTYNIPDFTNRSPRGPGTFGVGNEIGADSVTPVFHGTNHQHESPTTGSDGVSESGVARNVFWPYGQSPNSYTMDRLAGTVIEFLGTTMLTSPAGAGGSIDPVQVIPQSTIVAFIIKAT